MDDRVVGKADKGGFFRWQPTPERAMWGAIGGLLAGLVTGAIFHALGTLGTVQAQLVGSTSTGAGWAVHLIAGILFGVLFAVVFDVRTLIGAVAIGATYGWLLGVAVWILALAVGAGEQGEALPGRTMGMPIDQMVVHVLWGAIVALAVAYGAGAGARVAERRPERSPRAP